MVFTGNSNTYIVHVYTSNIFAFGMQYIHKSHYIAEKTHHSPVNKGHPSGVYAHRDVGAVGHVVGSSWPWEHAGSVGLSQGVWGRVVTGHLHRWVGGNQFAINFMYFSFCIT